MTEHSGPQRRSQDVDAYVGARMRELREEAGLTQKKLAERIGVTMQQCAKYERARDRLSATRVYTVAKALGVAPAALFPPLDLDPQTDSANAEFLALAATLNTESLRFLNKRVLDLLAAEGGR